jgi:hypothetical protein
MSLFHWLIVGTVVYIIYLVAAPSKKPIKHKSVQHPSSPPQQGSGYKDTFAWPDIGNYDFEIVGENNYQANIDAILKNTKADFYTAELVPEPNNQYDPKAVRVDINGLVVGYLSRDDARSFNRRLGNKKISGMTTICKADFTGGHMLKSGETASYGVLLDIKPFNN